MRHNWCMAEIMWHRRETRRQMENTHVMPGALEGLILLDNSMNLPILKRLQVLHDPLLALRSTLLSPILTTKTRGKHGSGNRVDWRQLLAYITGLGTAWRAAHVLRPRDGINIWPQGVGANSRRRWTRWSSRAGFAVRRSPPVCSTGVARAMLARRYCVGAPAEG